MSWSNSKTVEQIRENKTRCRKQEEEEKSRELQLKA